MQHIDLRKDLPKVRYALNEGILFHERRYASGDNLERRCAVGAMLKADIAEQCHSYYTPPGGLEELGLISIAPGQLDDLEELQARHDFVVITARAVAPLCTDEEKQKAKFIELLEKLERKYGCEANNSPTEERVQAVRADIQVAAP